MSVVSPTPAEILYLPAEVRGCLPNIRSSQFESLAITCMGLSISSISRINNKTPASIISECKIVYSGPTRTYELQYQCEPLEYLIMVPPRSTWAFNNRGFQAKLAAGLQKRGRKPAKAKDTADDGTTPKRTKKAVAGTKADKQLKDVKVKKQKQEVPAVNWAKLPSLTQKVLSYIEEHEACRTSLGFSKGDGPEVGTHDVRTQTAWYKEISIYALKDDASGLWADISPEVFGGITRNRINKCKKDFFKAKEMLGQTGNRIVMDDREAELTGALQDLWEKAEEVCPEYKHWHALLATSPIYDTSACSNSGSTLDNDLGILMRHPVVPDVDISSDNEADVSSSRDPSLPPVVAIGEFDDSSEDDAPSKVVDGKKAASAMPAVSAAAAKPTTVSAGSKCRNHMLTAIGDIQKETSGMFLQVTDEAGAEGSGRDRRAQSRAFLREDRERRRMHEEKQMQFQIEMMRLRAGISGGSGGSGSTGGLNLHGMGYGTGMGSEGGSAGGLNVSADTLSRGLFLNNYILLPLFIHDLLSSLEEVVHREVVHALDFHGKIMDGHACYDPPNSEFDLIQGINARADTSQGGEATFEIAHCKHSCQHQPRRQHSHFVWTTYKVGVSQNLWAVARRGNAECQGKPYISSRECPGLLRVFSGYPDAEARGSILVIASKQYDGINPT
ncbi:hypothetical protein GGX14DRAFT_583172 [Mycena pura]|uniref:Uncharacterized protein n=1 Tax=Mycena pura TaxID=153505 RepID=A0AAD7E6J0_9AGAR|nr:hypothetical protein GGX14DRAFT_583172 [Mycena pura]